MKLTRTALVLILAAAGFAAIVAKSEEKGSTSSFTQVSEKKSTLGKVPNVPGGNIEIYIDKDSIQEDIVEDITIRTASVVYHLNTPLEVKDKKVYFIYRTVGYHCDTKNFLVSSTVLYGATAEEPLFSVPSDDEIEKAEEGSPVMAEVDYVCKFQVKKPDNKVPSRAKSKSIDI